MAAAPTLDTTMSDLVGRWPSARSVLARRGMACLGCSMAAFETIAEAASAYGVDALALIAEVGASRRARVATTSPPSRRAAAGGARRSSTRGRAR